MYSYTGRDGGVLNGLGEGLLGEGLLGGGVTRERGY